MDPTTRGGHDSEINNFTDIRGGAPEAPLCLSVGSNLLNASIRKRAYSGN